MMTSSSQVPAGDRTAPTRTLVAFHAHPDDEALLTAGTMAKAAAAGHRVVLVLATDGGLGLAAPAFHDGSSGLGGQRLAEAQRSARRLGVARVEWLGYADSGSGPEVPPNTRGQVRFCRAPVEQAAERLAAILRTERADVLLGYDRNGGYGHRDHVRVHEVARLAAEIAATPRVLEATVPRDTITAAIRWLARIYPFPDHFDPSTFEHAFSAREEITHRIDVVRYAAAKRAAMRAHASQGSGTWTTKSRAPAGAQTPATKRPHAETDRAETAPAETLDGREAVERGDRTLTAFLKIPRPLFDLVFGREWYSDPAVPPGSPVSRDIFEGLG